jgi:DNA gyrase subunit A
MSDLIGQDYIPLENTMKDSYLKYSMSVIVSRALPDVRDGLKPVHRRALYGMHDLGVYPGKPYKKSARIVGDVIGKYHPHGDTAVYDTIVRMAQDFSLRYPLVDGQGNFGSVDGDSPAAMRYTEARMAKHAELMLGDLEKGTVDFQDNYDGSEREPTVVPAAFPNLIVNGSTGIAVGMATSMAPHNMTEVINGARAMIANPDITGEELFEIIPGPDFPTGGTIMGRTGIRKAALTGRGRAVVRSKTHFEKMANGRERICVSEIPYMVNKARLIEKMAELVKEKKIEGISDLRDESDRTGMRIVIELKKDAVADVVLNQLFRYTQMQDSFSIYNLALVKKQPKLLNQQELLRYYLDHRHEVVIRRTQFELDKAAARAHILEGLKIAQDNIDEVVRIIKASSNQADARVKLEEAFSLSERQSEAIVAMRLGQLTALDVNKIANELAELMVRITDYRDILAREERRWNIIDTELAEVLEKFGDARRTAIEENFEEIEDEDLIPDDEMVISMSSEGYIKRTSVDTYRSQGRGGVGVNAANLKDEDFVRSVIVASNRSFLLFFTNLGRVHWLKTWRLPEVGRNGRGKAIVNMLRLADDEKISAVVPLKDLDSEDFIVMATKNGIINKMQLSHFSRPRNGGINAITLDDDDSLVSVQMSNDEQKVMLAMKQGRAIVFECGSLRSLGRGTRGVRGVKLAEGDKVVSMLALEEGKNILTVTENGYGKRTEPSEYRVTARGGKGIRNLPVDEKTGDVVFVSVVTDEMDLLVTTKNGTMMRTDISKISTFGRAARGVRVIRLREDDQAVDAFCFERPEVDEFEDNENLIEGEVVETTETNVDGSEESEASNEENAEGEA